MITKDTFDVFADHLLEEDLGPIGPYQPSTDPYDGVVLPSIETVNQAWVKQGRCTGINAIETIIDFFDGTKSGIKRAKEVCEACTVKAECLEYALTTRQIHGVWGGMDEAERRILTGP